MQLLIIEGRLLDINEIIKLSKSHYAAYSTSKKEYTQLIAYLCMAQKIKPMKRIDFIFKHYRKNKQMNKDNIAGGAQKLVFDGLQLGGIIKNDGWSEIGNFTHKFYIDKNERIEVEMEEV